MNETTIGPSATEDARFAFGKNWSYFLNNIDEAVIRRAEVSLQTALATQRLEGRSFFDIGSGSGLFSLAAWRLGADVCSIDLDEDSVRCTRELRRGFAEDDGSRWRIEQGSALDVELLGELGKFDIVYSWGVLHHTGEMWRSIEHAAAAVANDGQLFLAIYNDQGAASRRWTKIKRLYNRLPSSLRLMILIPSLLRIWGPTTVRDLLRLRPFHTWRTYQSNRGMNAWRDLIDWVGGYPFEVARPEEVFQFCRERNFSLTHMKTCGGGRGCNEFVFANVSGQVERHSHPPT